MPGCYQGYATYFCGEERREMILASWLYLHSKDHSLVPRRLYQDFYGACVDQHMEEILVWTPADIWLLQHSSLRNRYIISIKGERSPMSCKPLLKSALHNTCTSGPEVCLFVCLFLCPQIMIFFDSSLEKADDL